MPQVPRDIVKERARRLRSRGEVALTAHLDGMVGRAVQVLTETRDLGRTQHFTPVRFESPVEPGEIVD
ncbi:hypothetical protein, partial [Acinetobacter baumannii]|uniref:hypothetical protein n=1 Tax=Acinetobacter baumannii TaxID=470 RepID=UPI001C09F141